MRALLHRNERNQGYKHSRSQLWVSLMKRVHKVLHNTHILWCHCGKVCKTYYAFLQKIHPCLLPSLDYFPQETTFLSFPWNEVWFWNTKVNFLHDFKDNLYFLLPNAKIILIVHMVYFSLQYWCALGMSIPIFYKANSWKRWQATFTG